MMKEEERKEEEEEKKKRRVSDAQGNVRPRIFFFFFLFLFFFLVQPPTGRPLCVPASDAAGCRCCRSAVRHWPSIETGELIDEGSPRHTHTHTQGPFTHTHTHTHTLTRTQRNTRDDLMDVTAKKRGGGKAWPMN